MLLPFSIDLQTVRPVFQGLKTRELSQKALSKSYGLIFYLDWKFSPNSFILKFNFSMRTA
jgi:hypothetical protein